MHRLTVVLITANPVANSLTRSSICPSTPSDSMYENENTVAHTLGVLVEKARAIMRGVNWVLAICTTSSMDDSTNTMNVSMDAFNPPRTAFAPSAVKLNHCQCKV